MSGKPAKNPEETAEAATTLDDTFQQITQLLRQRESKLDERERELDKRQKTLEHDNPMLGGSSDVLHLNVTGTKMVILRRTLTTVEGSMLAAQFSGRWDDTLPKDNDGSFLINQPLELWKPMMDYLHDKECETPLTPGVLSPVFDDERLRTRFYQMVEYFQMTLGVYPFNLCKVAVPEGIGPVVASHPDYAIASPDIFVSYTLVSANVHERCIKSFEVTVGAFTSILVGWSVSGVKNLYTEYPEGRGVGYASNSIALDCSKSSMVYKKPDIGATTVTTHIPGLSLVEGSVIRCEDFGHKWYVNGKLVACVGQEEGVRSIPEWPSNRLTAMPYVSAQGAFRVSKIELQFP